MAVDGHLNFDTIIKTSGFQKGLKNIGNTLNSLKGAAMNLAGAFGIAFSAAALINFSKSAKEAYNVQLEGETKLATVLGEHLDATEEQIQAAKDYASALQEIGVIGDEVQLAGLQELSTYIENPDSLKTMNGVLNDMLAQQYGLNASAESAVTISTMLGKVLAGQTSALSRYGYTFDEAQEQLLKYGTEEQRVATLADVVLSSVGGMNEALAQTPAGRMKQLENTMSDIKERFGEAVTQIEVLLLPALKQVANALQFIADKANEVTQALSKVFGAKTNKQVSTAGTGSVNADLTDSTESLSDEAEDAADSYEEMAKAAEEANKVNRENLATFDELNVLSKESADNISETFDNPAEEETDELSQSVTLDVEADTDEAESALTKLIKNVKNSIMTLFEPIKTSWNKYGEDVIESVKNRFTSVKNLIFSIGKTFSEVWSNGTGENIIGNILSIFTNINDTISNIADNFRTAWDSGVGLSIVQTLADTLNIVLEHVNNISEKTSEWSQSADFEPVLTAFNDLLTPIQKIVDIAGTWAENVWDKVFLPLASWAIEEGVPAALDAIGGFLDLVAAIGETVGNALAYIWDNFLSNLVSWVGDGIVSFLETFGQFLKDVSENQTAVTTLVVIAEVIAAVVTAIVSIKAALTVLPAVIVALSNPIGWIIAAIAAIVLIIIEVITYWDTLKQIFSDGVNFLKDKFKRFADWFKTGWSQFANWWTDKVTSLLDKVKGFANGAIGFINGILQGAAKGINRIIDLINNLSWDIPDWVPVIGGGTFGFNIQHITPPQIPYLATGTVVPANYGEFAAILGDNKREPEVVSPISTMKQAFIEALTEGGYLGERDDRDIVIQIDRKEIFRAVKKENDAQKRRHGGKSQLA